MKLIPSDKIPIQSEVAVRLREIIPLPNNCTRLHNIYKLSMKISFVQTGIPKSLLIFFST